MTTVPRRPRHATADIKTMEEDTTCSHRRLFRAAFILVWFIAPMCDSVASEESHPSSKMECHTVGDQIMCQVVLDKTASKWKLNHCIENDGICLEGVITQQSGTSKFPHEDDVEKAKRGSLAEAFKERMALQREQKREVTSHAEGEPSLAVGSQTYHSPYLQYGSEVGNALKVLAGHISRDADDLDLADAHALLAMAHRGEYGKDPIFLPSFNVEDISIQDLNRATNAFKEALRLYQQALSDIRQPGERDDITITIATIASILADTVQMHPDEADLDEALQFYQLSEQSFGSLLSEAARRLDAETYEDIELRWADAASRLAVLQIEKIQNVNVGLEDVMTSSALPDFDVVLHDVREGQTKFDKAIKIYRTASVRKERYPGQQIEQKLLLANTLYSAGSASVLLAQNDRAIKQWKESLDIFRELSSQGDSVEQDEHNLVIAELLYSLSDVYLQMGMYDETNERYGEAMKLFSQLGAPPSVVAAQMTVSDANDILQLQGDMLREYYESLSGGQEVHIPDDYRDPNDPYYERDDLHEADLHASMGALSMAQNEMEAALGHFNKALELYSSSLGGQDRAVADIKINLASVYMRLGEYDDSDKARREAVEIYRVVVGEGKNPLLDEELLGELKATIPEASKDKGEDSSKEDTDDNKKIHERLIDVDEYRRSFMNRTQTITDEL